MLILVAEVLVPVTNQWIWQQTQTHLYGFILFMVPSLTCLILHNKYIHYNALTNNIFSKLHLCMMLMNKRDSYDKNE